MNRAVLRTIFLSLLLFGGLSPFVQAQDGKIEFTGILDDAAASQWMVDGHVVVVGADTELKTDNGPLETGACIQVEGVSQPDGSVQAEKIESKDASECEENPDQNGDDGEDDVQFKGVISSAPDGGAVGAWQIGGRNVTADEDTEFSTDNGALEVGACAEVEGTSQEDGSVLAASIKSESGSDCAQQPGEGDERGEAEIQGLIESLPNMLIGEWNVNGRIVQVNDYTELDDDNTAFAVGVCVEAEGVIDGDGVLIAREISSRSAAACESGNNTEAEFIGELETLPASGVAGDWTVDGTKVRVLPSTEIQAGPVALGACLKVEGSTLASGVVQARQVRVLSAAGGCSYRPGEKDDDVSFDGVVQQSPSEDNIGLWVISGRSVLVDDMTDVELQGQGSHVGVCVQVQGAYVDHEVIAATKLEADNNGRNCGAGSGEPTEVELSGLIEELPNGNPLGQWSVNGVDVTVSGSTELDQELGEFAVGTCVKASGRFLPSGNLQAREIETQEMSDCGEPGGPVGEVEFRGIATAAPDDAPNGVWTIGFQPVEINDDTELSDETGSLRVGACVKVEGSRQQSGNILARQIEVESVSGSCFLSSGVVNAATFNDGAISPGEIITIFGLRLGPANGAELVVDNGLVQSHVGGVRVWFDSTPAPILFAGEDQVNVVAPFSIAGKDSVQLQVENGGIWTRPIRLQVRDANPGLLTLSQTGAGQAAALNVNGETGELTVNGADNPTSAGQIVSLYAVGMGAFTDMFEDGLVVGSDLPMPNLPVTVTIGGQEAEVLYAGGAPGLVLGVLQVNVVVPDGVTAGDDVPVTLQVGDYTSPDGVTLAIQ